jgi:LysM repeat protein
VVLATASVAIAFAAVGFAILNFGVRYAGLIYPGVSVHGIDLGGLTVDQAFGRLAERLPDPETTPVTLRSGDHRWACVWSDLGVQYDAAATAQLAFDVGRHGTPEERYQTQLRALVAGHQLSPVVLLPDPEVARAVLEEMALELLVPPVNAGLVIDEEGVNVTPAQAGRELDVEETVSVLPHAFGFSAEGLSFEMLTRPVEPALVNPGAVKQQAEAILAEPFLLAADDPLFEFSQVWRIPREEVAGWLGAQTVEGEHGTRLELTIDDEAVQDSVARLNDELTHELVALEVKGTAPVVRAAIEAGEHSASATLVHPPRPYMVLRGDTLMSIAAKFGYPAWRLVEANPDIDIDRLQPGQEITIPTIDLLFPLPLIRDQRIVVDISEQHLYAYEGDTLVHDFIASTGIRSSPTITGTFQVLSKEEEAYASNWDLHMPHFVAVYESAPGFFNGIHGLPSRTGYQVLWENSLGRPVSFGCIVLGLEEAEIIYDWAELGALVEIRQ